jgi:hypothetical protein
MRTKRTGECNVTLRLNSIVGLSNPKYVPVIKDFVTYYGGSQNWFPADKRFSKDYILHNYGCGTIATADMFLYFALQNEALRSPETEIALNGAKTVEYTNYQPYVRRINDRYTNTRRIIAVLGPKIAAAINKYAETNGFGYRASWKWTLSYYDMYDVIEEMLSQDLPVILSIGPNIPLLWGKKGVPFYQKCEIEYQENPDESVSKPYYYKVVQNSVNSHYVTVTGIIKDDITNAVMLRISSWGKQFYVNYEEYRDYIESFSSTITSSVVRITRLKS